MKIPRGLHINYPCEITTCEHPEVPSVPQFNKLMPTVSNGPAQNKAFTPALAGQPLPLVLCRLILGEWKQWVQHIAYEGSIKMYVP